MHLLFRLVHFYICNKGNIHSCVKLCVISEKHPQIWEINSQIYPKLCAYLIILWFKQVKPNNEQRQTI